MFVCDLSYVRTLIEETRKKKRKLRVVGFSKEGKEKKIILTVVVHEI